MESGGRVQVGFLQVSARIIPWRFGLFFWGFPIPIIMEYGGHSDRGQRAASAGEREGGNGGAHGSGWGMVITAYSLPGNFFFSI